MWYVIQVINGREDVMRERIEHMVPAGAMQELFYPQFQTEIKVHGEWVNTTKPLFPGYLICDTADPRTVQQYLLRMDDFARVLSQDGQFVPLAKEEVQLIGSFTHGKARLLFEVTNKGVLKVEPKIDGDDSKGIKEVSIFAFDLACVIIGSEGGYIPGFLIHDSHLFDAMDDRQLCSCLNIGARLSDEHGLQYIVLLNTDRLEAVELIGFDRANYPIETILTDKGDDSGLFGFRFN